MNSTVDEYDVFDLTEHKLSKQGMSKLMIVLHDEEDVYKSIELDRESRKYIHFIIKNKVHTYHYGSESIKTLEYSLRKCTSDDLYSTIYERKFYKRRVEEENHHIYCTKNEDPIYLQGTFDSIVAKKSHAYIVYDIVRCTEATRNAGDPECADEDAIDKWTEYKKIGIRIINKTIDNSSYNKNAFR